jgi:hypothetical protein
MDVYLVNIQPMPSTLFEQRARLDLRIQNLTESQIDATGVDLRLIVNDRQLARGVDNKAFSVAPLADVTTSVVVSSSVFDTLRQLLTFQNRQSFSYSMKGKIFATGFNKSFRRSGELTRSDIGKLVETTQK